MPPTAPPAAVDAPAADVLVLCDDDRELRTIDAALRHIASRITAPAAMDPSAWVFDREPALALLDVHETSRDAFEVAHSIRATKRLRHVPIVFIAAETEIREMIDRAYAMGAADVLAKPLVPAVLRAKAAVFVELDRRVRQARASNQDPIGWTVGPERRIGPYPAGAGNGTAVLPSGVDGQKDAFLAILAHELRNPLGPLLSGIELLKTIGPADAAFVSVRQAMERQVLHLKNLVDGLFDLHRLTSGSSARGERYSPRVSDRKTAEGPTLEPRRIVLVEDHEDVASVVSSLLAHWGHRVEIARSGPEGIETILSRRPDLAIVDISLPGCDGYGVAIAVRARLGAASPALVAMTGYGQQHDRRRALAAGFLEHIVKPATASDLRAALRLAATERSDSVTSAVWHASVQAVGEDLLPHAHARDCCDRNS